MGADQDVVLTLPRSNALENNTVINLRDMGPLFQVRREYYHGFALIGLYILCIASPRSQSYRNSPQVFPLPPLFSWGDVRLCRTSQNDSKFDIASEHSRIRSDRRIMRLSMLANRRDSS